MAAAKSSRFSDEEARKFYALCRDSSRATAFRNSSESPQELSLTDLRILLYLEQQAAGTPSMGELARELHFTHAWASRVVYELGNEGLLESVRDERDRRLVHVKLTDRERERRTSFRQLSRSQIILAAQ